MERMGSLRSGTTSAPILTVEADSDGSGEEVFQRKAGKRKKHKTKKLTSKSVSVIVASLAPPAGARDAFADLVQAVHEENVEQVRELVQKHPSTVGYLSADGEAPLHIAVASPKAGLVTALLSAGANPNQRAADKRPPLLLAVEHGNLSAALALLKYGADPGLEWMAPDGVPTTALLQACRGGDVELVRALLESGHFEDKDVNYLVNVTASRDVATDSRLKITKSKKVVFHYRHRALEEHRLRQSLAKSEEGAESDEEEEEGSDHLRVCHSEPTTTSERKAAGQCDDMARVSNSLTILDVVKDDAIREVLEAYGGTTSLEYLVTWVSEHATASMGEFCQDVQKISKMAVAHGVILVPGLCSSVLECWRSKQRPDWIGQRLWLSVQRMGLPATLRGLKSRSGALSNEWLDHMMLAEDGFSDREGISVRPSSGLHAVDYLCSVVGKEGSYVLAHLINSLKAGGFTPQNLDAFPYDWRLPPNKLEERDGAFTALQHRIELMVKLNSGKRVILMGHSMGNKFIHYFLFWAEQNLGRPWIDANVRCFMALGAPWIGAAKAVRALITGDAMGLDLFLSYDETLAMSRNFGSACWLVPNDGEAWREAGMESVIYEYDRETKTHPPAAYDHLLDHCEKHKQMNATLYDADPLYGGCLDGSGIPTVLRPPPVAELVCIYGKNLPTEVSYIYKKLRDPKLNTYGEPVTHKLDRSHKAAKRVLAGKQGFEAKHGIIYKVPATTDSGEALPSGDGTVPYVSLSYHKRWEGLPGAPKITTVEVEGAEHREMLSMPLVLGPILHRINGVTSA